MNFLHYSTFELNPQFFWALIVTILAEFLLILAVFRKRVLKLFFYSTLINCFTLPLATYFYHRRFFSSEGLLLIEVAVFLVESFLFWLLLKRKFYKSLLLSFIVNLGSFLLGVFLFPQIFI